MAQVEDRTLYVRIRTWTLADAGGKLRCATVTPFAIVADDRGGRRVIPLPDVGSGEDLGAFLSTLFAGIAT